MFIFFKECEKKITLSLFIFILLILLTDVSQIIQLRHLPNALNTLSKDTFDVARNKAFGKLSPSLSDSQLSNQRKLTKLKLTTYITFYLHHLLLSTTLLVSWPIYSL